MSESKHTPGPWKVFICDDGGKWSGWPLAITAVNDEDKNIARPGGFYPYTWDAAMSQREAVANARLIAAAPDMYDALKAIAADSRFISGEPLLLQTRAAIAKAGGRDE